MPTYEMMVPDEIQVVHFNPSKRIDRTRLTGLLLSIQEHGILEPLVLTRDLFLADGHRRLACAKLLKLEEVPVAIYKENALSAPQLWVVLNSDTMNLTPAQWLAAVDAGLPLDTPGFPDTLRRRITRLMELVGQDAITLLVEQGRSPMIVDAAERLLRYVDRRGDEVFMRKSVEWLLHYGNAWTVRTALEGDIPADILVEAIEEGREIVRLWGVVGE